MQRSLSKNRPIRLSVSAARLRSHKLRGEMFSIIDGAIGAGAQPAGYGSVPLGYNSLSEVAGLREAS
nr:hypothetical protein [Corynebacterium lactis]